MPKRKASQAEDRGWSLADASPLRYLCQPEDVSTFKSDVWGRRPRLYNAKERALLFRELGRFSDLRALLKSEGAAGLGFGRDLNAARYKNSVRETLNSESADLGTVDRLFREGCTLQWHQPQRWVDGLWRLIAALEAELGCLVGANAYITPKGTQGLAPHYDDVDLWVCQTEGSKRWRIYEDREGYSLPAVSSNDFSQASLGTPVMEITLDAGDVLYMPRGTVHQATAQDTDSCHITISTYQKWSRADLSVALLQALQQGRPATPTNSATLPLPALLREGVAVGFLYSAGLQADAGQQKTKDAVAVAASTTRAPLPSELLLLGPLRPLGVIVELQGFTPRAGVSNAFLKKARSAAHALRDLADRLESEPALISLAADHMALDFMTSRMPPYPTQLPDRGPVPGPKSRVKSMGKGFSRMLRCQAGPEIIEAYGDELDFVRVASCLKNRREEHMMPSAAAIEDEAEDGCCTNGHCTSADPGSHHAKKASLEEEVKSMADDEGASEELGSKDSSDDTEEDDEDGDSGADLVFPASYAGALAQLLDGSDAVAVKDVRMASSEERLGLVRSLWEEGLICTLENTDGRKKMRSS